MHSTIPDSAKQRHRRPPIILVRHREDHPQLRDNVRKGRRWFESCDMERAVKLNKEVTGKIIPNFQASRVRAPSYFTCRHKQAMDVLWSTNREPSSGAANRYQDITHLQTLPYILTWRSRCERSLPGVTGLPSLLCVKQERNTSQGDVPD